jgi:hypothetical protein
VKEDLIKKIVRMEWDMFSRVSNVGGKASCQYDPETFEIMRYSQAKSRPEDVLESLLADLEEAGRCGRNLMSEKYARMMESTFPDEYGKIADMLPPVDRDALALIEEIVAVNIDWKLEAVKKYPFLGGRGRPVRAGDDAPWAASFETYLRGELKTYSPETVRRLHRHTLRLRDAGMNGVEENLLNQAGRYGFTSLADAEKAAAASACRGMEPSRHQPES